MRVAVIGYGNPLRSDDGAGIEAVRQLELAWKGEARVCFFEGYSGMDLLRLFGQFQHMILIDTADLAKPAGEFTRLPMAQIRFADDWTFTHGTNFKAALDLAKKLDFPIPPITFYLIQPASLEIGEGLTPHVSRGVDKMVKAVSKEIRAILGDSHA
jgi:hydrogenase maturation protease